MPVVLVVAPVDPLVKKPKELNLDASDLTIVTDLFSRLKKESNETQRIQILKEIKTLNICSKKPIESAFWSEQLNRQP